MQVKRLNKKLPSVPPKQSSFQISPPEVVFQNFDTCDVCEMTLSLMNKDKVPQVVKVSMESSPYFQLVSPNDAYRAVPPGASAPVRIRFSPDENKDYCHELVCITARERIVVPIRAIGARAVLDFPAQLDFSKCPVKVSTQQTLLVRNVGARAARYQLSTQSPFSVVPATGALGAGDTVQVTVAFHPLASGAHCGSLAVRCSSGEERIHTKLHGEAVDVNIGLSTNSVEVDKTFITMSSHRTLFIENRSNITAHFQWKAFPTEEDKNKENRRQCLLRLLKEVSQENFPEEKETEKDKRSCEDRSALLSNMVHEEMAKLPEDPMLFSDDVFVIEPMEGEIGPNCLAEIKVTFKPLEALEYQSVAYCSISGRESRLPLQLRGEGQGPLVELSSQTLNIGNVFVNTPHAYEVKLMNQGAIDAPFICIPSTTNVGFCFEFAPKKGIIAPGGIQIILISFSASILGKFEEEFQFSVVGSPTPAILTIKGSVTEQTPHFKVDKLSFGDVSFGSPYTKTHRLPNISPVSHITLRGQAHFPRLQIQPSTLEFGCIVGGTEEVHSLEMTNCSSLPVQFHWSICLDSQGNRSSIMPQLGVLQPGERQKVSFTYSGHLSIIAGARALCCVEGGPTYEVKLIASRVSYSLSLREINCGSQMFNEVGHSKVTLENTGKIEFNWVLNPSTADKHLPGVFLVKPTTGSIAPGKKQVLKFSYLPALPGAFSRIYQLQVGDLDPENIFLKGEATCPMISVNLPWTIKENKKYEKPLKQPVKHLQQYSQRNKSEVLQKKTQSLTTETLKSQTLKAQTLKAQTPKTQTLETQNLKTQDLQPRLLGSGIAPNTQLQIKTMKMLIEKAALELQKKLTSHPRKSRFPDKELCQSLVKVELPEYVLDMGTVLKGFTESSTLEITNPGQIPVFFQVNVSVLQDTGFSVDLGLMKSLPPSHSVALDVRFESARWPQGDVDVLLPIEVRKGPTFHIRLHATVLEVSLDLSKKTLQFSDILVGQCQVETIQLYNQFQVPCKWSIKPVLKKNQLKHTTPAIRQKRLALEDEPCPFEVTPSKGTLDAGRWQNLQIQFTPNEERSYKNELKLNICGSSNHLKLHLSGQGLEARLEFSPPALKMGRVLVGSDGVEATVVVKNPCTFPIEFYSLDFDEQYLEEEKMLKHLGLHPEGPPLPPAAVLSMVKYPEERLGPAERVEPFTIVAPGGAAMEDNLAKAPDVKGSSTKGQPKTGKVVSRDNSSNENLISTQRRKSPWDSFATRSKSMLKSASTPTEFLRLKRYRWTVPAHGEVELKVHFSTKKPGSFEQTLRFELVQTKCQYELPCRGTGLYPSISQNPRLVFPQWRKIMKEDEIIFKEYVESTKQFHFGPLLCGKSREWYKAQNCPRNSENLTILNNSPGDVEVQFSFESAGEAETFLLDPPNMSLKPKEKQELTIWAFPTCPGFLEDKLICSIGKNPEPVVFSLCCHGVDMKLEVSPLELSFDKLLLHRTDSRTLVLKNNTLLPMVWQLSGLEDLVEAFSLSQESGTIDPRSELEVTLHFKARQIGSIEKTLQLEVSDTKNILRIVQAENIKISAEVYDVSVSIDMPEGLDGSLEFGTINVLDNVKKVLSLKNKGLYNIEYRFTLKGAGPRMRDLASHFTVVPQSGVLIASQPAVNVEMLFHPTSEIFLKNKPILYCQVMDASSGRGGQAVANIPVRVSATAEYSKYSIEPASPIDFGAMAKGTKKSQTVLLENKGTLSFKFRIRQAPELASALESKSSKEGESAPSAPKRSMRRKLSSSTQARLNLGMFTVSPCSGSIRPWGQQKITVECLARQEGTCEEQLYIDITGTDPRDNPLGIPVTLIAESCLPALVEDVASIFKEYLICSSADLDHKLQSVKGTGLFVRNENRFIFSKVQVGQETEAHFNIYNASRLPCDVVLSIKPLPGEEKSSINNIFKLYPVKMSIPSSSCAVATVTFTPPDEQNYHCTFKASLVIPKGSVEIKLQMLTFTISGKGHEPQLTVVCPSARSKRGNAVLCFKRLRLGDSEMLPLVVCNNGIIPVKFMLRLEDEHGAFFLRGRASTPEMFHTGDVEEDSVGNESKPPEKPFFLLHRGQSAEFDVTFKPTLTQHLEGKICVLVGDTYSNKTLIELVGEGHKDEFTLDGLEEDTHERNAKCRLKKDITDAFRLNHIQFGDCRVGKICCRTFTITNHAQTKVMRFEWEADAPFQFFPRVGHLHPGCTKGITVTLQSDVPATFRRHLVKCKVTKINFEVPGTKVPDWDDQMFIVPWKSTTRIDPGHKFPRMQKVVEIAMEPAHTVLEESSQEVEVYLSAVVAYTQFKLSTTMVQFSDTLPFQTRTAIFSIHNTGEVALEYSWEKAAESEPVKKPYSITLMRRFLCDDTQQEQPKQQHRSKKLRRSKQKHLSLQRATSSLEVFPNVIHDLFSINPYNGTIAPGQKETFHLQFSPRHAGKFKTTLLCRIPNLKPAQKMGRVIVKGRAREEKTLGEPLELTEKGQGAKKEWLWRAAPEGQRLCQLEHPAGAGNTVPSAADGPFSRDPCSTLSSSSEDLYLTF
ncbi:hydrocephalus-inducing protein homolog [Agelaius phoeniceus]|uniref:hydrocephalus-inducing protein homolog n=1 Tax=Agelaius phoeniceus TaxID=39638 RepID=UPI00405518DE